MSTSPATRSEPLPVSAVAAQRVEEETQLESHVALQKKIIALNDKHIATQEKLLDALQRTSEVFARLVQRGEEHLNAKDKYDEYSHTLNASKKEIKR